MAGAGCDQLTGQPGGCCFSAVKTTSIRGVAGLINPHLVPVFDSFVSILFGYCRCQPSFTSPYVQTFIEEVGERGLLCVDSARCYGGQVRLCQAGKGIDVLRSVLRHQLGVLPFDSFLTLTSSWCRPCRVRAQFHEPAPASVMSYHGAPRPPELQIQDFL